MVITAKLWDTSLLSHSLHPKQERNCFPLSLLLISLFFLAQARREIFGKLAVCWPIKVVDFCFPMGAWVNILDPGTKCVPQGSVAACLAGRPQVLHFVRFMFDECTEVE